MNKRDLIASFPTDSGLTLKEATAVVTLFFDEMTEALAKNERAGIQKPEKRHRSNRRNCHFLNMAKS